MIKWQLSLNFYGYHRDFVNHFGISASQVNTNMLGFIVGYELSPTYHWISDISNTVISGEVLFILS